jgi:C_GCAxxG_C_C family probable redox protein
LKLLKRLENEEAEKIKLKACTLAAQYEEKHFNCAQSVVAAIQDVLDIRNDEVFRAASGLAGGIGISGDCCGAYCGGVMILSYLHGRTREQYTEPYSEKKYSMKAYRLAKRLRDRFIGEYKSVLCRDIQEKTFGRSFNFWNLEDNQAFEEAGGHRPNGCPRVVGNAASWIVEILSSKQS